MTDMRSISTYCKEFRTNTLQMPLKTVCEITGTNIKTLSAFEVGRTANFENVLKYLAVCDEEQKDKFVEGLADLLRGD